MTVKTIDMIVVKDLAKELELQGRREEAGTLDALIEMLSLPGGYYTSDEVAKKLNVPSEIILALVQKGIFRGILVQGRALIPKSELFRFEETAALSQELDTLLASYTQDDLHRFLKEARQEWQSQKLF
jgi:hypothetical protein